jgi:hypothetical protein
MPLLAAAHETPSQYAERRADVLSRDRAEKERAVKYEMRPTANLREDSIGEDLCLSVSGGCLRPVSECRCANPQRSHKCRCGAPVQHAGLSCSFCLESEDEDADDHDLERKTAIENDASDDAA